MTTSAQAIANRENSKLSTGPTTEAGKAVSSRNHLVHGLCSADPVLPTEDRAQFNELVEKFKMDLKPRGFHQHILVGNMAAAHWKLQRIARIEIDMFAKLDDPAQAFNDKETAAAFARLDRYRASLERSFHRCSRELLSIQKVELRIEANMRKVEAAANLAEFKAKLYAPVPQKFLDSMAEDRRKRAEARQAEQNKQG